MLRAFDHICMEKARYDFLIIIIIIIIFVVVVVVGTNEVFHRMWTACEAA